VVLAVLGVGLLLIGIVAVAFGVLPVPDALALGERIAPVLGFVVAITVVAALTTRAGVFDRIADGAARLGRGRGPVLWLLVVAVAVVATVFLSLDTTAVLLTPIVVTLARRVGLGAGYGLFDRESMIKFWVSYRVSDTLSLESTLGQVQGVFSGTTLWHVNLQAEPWSDQRFSPFMGIGIGMFKNIPNQSLVNFQPTNARLADAIIGARYHLTDRFMIRADYAIYTAFVSDQRSLEYRAATAGLSFFF